MVVLWFSYGLGYVPLSTLKTDAGSDRAAGRAEVAEVRTGGYLASDLERSSGAHGI